MSDTLSRTERSALMARIRGTHTKPEKIVRSALRLHGFTMRLHVRSLPGKPDIVVPSCRAAIFVNGCFWHQHLHCKRAALPTTRLAFWKNKLLGNAARDRRNKYALRRLGWKAITIWQCQLGTRKAKRRLVSLVQMLQALHRKQRNSVAVG
jgi:DNA mismatch endonuclease (patch repair protein)